MNKKSKVIAIAFGAVATVAAPVAVAASVSSCGSGTSDGGSTNGQQSGIQLNASAVNSISSAIKSTLQGLNVPTAIEAIQSNIKTAVEQVVQPIANGITVGTVEVTQQPTDSTFKKYSVSVKLNSTTPLTIATDGELSVQGDVLSTKASVASQIPAKVMISNADLDLLNTTLKNQVQMLSDNSAASMKQAARSIQDSVNQLEFVKNNDLSAYNITLPQDTFNTGSDNLHYFVTLGLSSTYNDAVVYPTNTPNFSISSGILASTSSFPTQITGGISVAQYASNTLLNFKTLPVGVYSPSQESPALLCNNYPNAQEAQNDLQNAQAKIIETFKQGIANAWQVDPSKINVTNSNSGNLSVNVSVTLTSADNQLCQKMYGQTYSQIANSLKDCSDYNLTIGSGNQVNNIQLSMNFDQAAASKVGDKNLLTFTTSSPKIVLNGMITPKLQTSTNPYVSGTSVAVVFEPTSSLQNGSIENIASSIVVSNAVARQISTFVQQEIIGQVQKAEYMDWFNSQPSADETPTFKKCTDGINKIFADNNLPIRIMKTRINPECQIFDPKVNNQYQFSGLYFYTDPDQQSFTFEDSSIFNVDGSASEYPGSLYITPSQVVKETWLLKSIPTTVLHISAEQIKQAYDVFAAQAPNFTGYKTANDIKTVLLKNCVNGLDEFLSSVQGAPSPLWWWLGTPYMTVNPDTGEQSYNITFRVTYHDKEYQKNNNILLTIDESPYAEMQQWNGDPMINFTGIPTNMEKFILLNNNDKLNQIYEQLKTTANTISDQNMDLQSLKSQPVTTKINEILGSIQPGLKLAWYSAWEGFDTYPPINGHKAIKLGFAFSWPPGYTGVYYPNLSANVRIAKSEDYVYLIPVDTFETQIPA